MTLGPADWSILLGYLGLSVALGAFFSRRGGRSVDDYFVAGRRLPWWLAGMTMVATSFAIDTPLGITGLVAEHGIQGVWFAWAFALGSAGTLGAFVFASLIRRSEALTTAELVELRYSGPEAAGLRLFKGIYFGLLVNAVTLGSILKAVWTVTEVVLGWNPHLTLAILLAFTLFYSTASGMWGIAATDVLQFVMGMAGLALLTAYSLGKIGGIDGLVDGILQRYGAVEGRERLQFFPRPGTAFFETFLVFITLQWWGNPPPAIHQRIVAAKDERHASFSTLLFCVLQFAVNYWPMIVVALVSLVLFPELPAAAAEQGYPRLIVELIPPGLLGLLLAAMMAAFMSTVDTHLNYGAAFLVNDIYRRFLRRDATESHYVLSARVSTLLMLLFAVAVAYSLDSVSGAWFYIATLKAGHGFLMVARWFWWRINAWSEITALAASGVVGTVLAPEFAGLLGYADAVDGWSFARRYLTVIGASTVAWLLVTLASRPCDEEHLVAFCRKVRPFPAFWGPVHQRHPEIAWDPGLGRALLFWASGSVAVYALCFGIGNLIFGAHGLGFGLVAVAVAILGAIVWSRRDRANGFPRSTSCP